MIPEMSSMSSDPAATSRTAAFTGHRTYCGQADALLGRLLEQLYGRGFRTFLSGMAVGFDLAAAEAVAALRVRHPDVRLVAVVPFRGQECRFRSADRMRWERIVAGPMRSSSWQKGIIPAVMPCATAIWWPVPRSSWPGMTDRRVARSIPCGRHCAADAN